ncbi:MAG: sialidase family protein [Bacteroidota bacterium]
MRFSLKGKVLIFSLLLITGITFVYGQKGANLSKVKDVIIYEDTAFFSAFPSVVKTEENDFLVAFRRAPNRHIFGERSNHHVDPNSYLVMKRSLDGVNWESDPALLYAHAFGGSQDPCMLQLKDGSILCASYGWAYVHPDGIEKLKEPFMQNKPGFIFLGGYTLRSDDNGMTWQGPYYPPTIPGEDRYDALGRPLPAYNRGAMCEGRDGRIFWVVAGHSKDFPKTSTHLLISDDKGLTWKYSCPVAVDKDISFNEASIHETSKGDLVVFLRTSGFDDQSCIARSTDGGKSFQPWEKMGFQGHPFHALRLPDDRVLLTYGYRHEPYGIRARILNKECTDYSSASEFIIREDGGTTDLGYPWSVLLNDTQALVVYYFNINDQTRHIAGSILDFSGR